MPQPVPVPPLAIAQLLPEPESDEPPLESDLHLFQVFLLLQGLKWAWRDRQDFYATGNLTIFYSPNQDKSQDFRGPDFFVVLGADPRPRRSWVVWNEGGRYPNVIVELLSASTARQDRGKKKQIYQDIFRTPNYFWFDPQSGEEFAGFTLVNGRYEAIAPNEQGWLWSDQLQLYLGKHAGKLRWFTAAGELLPIPEEDAEQAIAAAQDAQHQAAAAQQRADAAEQQAAAARSQQERLAAKLRELGVDPETLA
ncbi:MAG: Uma2 family endonuclease [Spirulinaceae cyanobacterium RM2_2_10]|nr:Uma2 family endonuclease [Spirulinaceae cyanobacterium SM2_1_0]NJO20206.1 Uma2 family endonuclease [Spirulinaceae cyanobacterium RM2_2_10]